MCHLLGTGTVIVQPVEHGDAAFQEILVSDQDAGVLDGLPFKQGNSVLQEENFIVECLGDRGDLDTLIANDESLAVGHNGIHSLSVMYRLEHPFV
ncbi:hypothetical protein GCM10027217_36060 [Pseudomaricurvus hydrocarbonicus]